MGLGIFLSGSAFSDVPIYRFLKEIPITHQDGGWDYVSIDPTASRLYLPQAQRVVVVDLQEGKVVGEITDTPGVHGFAIAPDLKRGFSSNGKESKVSVVGLDTLKTLSKVETGLNPDSILYEPSKQEVYAFNGKGLSVTVIQGNTGKVVATIPLPGRPEFAAVDPELKRVFVDIEDKNTVAVIDTSTHKVTAEWKLSGGDEPSGTAIDLKNHRLFVGCHNQKLLMLDSTSGKVLATIPIGKGVDAVFFDPDTQLLFTSNGEGSVTIAHEETPDTLKVVQTLITEKRARTMALDPKMHRIYLPSARFEQQDEKSRQRPKIIPGSLKLLVYGY